MLSRGLGVSLLQGVWVRRGSFLSPMGLDPCPWEPVYPNSIPFFQHIPHMDPYLPHLEAGEQLGRTWGCKVDLEGRGLSKSCGSGWI